MFLGVQHHQIRRADGHAVKLLQQFDLEPLGAAVFGSVSGEDKVVENNRNILENMPCQQHVEMSHITHEYGIWFAIVLHPLASVLAQPSPQAKKIPAKAEYLPRFLQDFHALSRGQFKRMVDFLDSAAVLAQTADENAYAGMLTYVIRAEREDGGS